MATSLEKRASLLERKGFFILATNELETSKLSNIELFTSYKNQGFVDLGFRFLKDPMFLVSSLYLKSPKKIMALLMVMTVCLLVYTTLEYRKFIYWCTECRKETWKVRKKYIQIWI